MTEYITIFEIPSKWTDYFIVLSISCAIIGLGLATALIFYLVKNWRIWQAEKKLKIEAVFAISLFFVWGVGWSFATYDVSKNIRFGKGLIEAYYSGNYEIIEGNVEVLHKQPKFIGDIGDIIRINQREIVFSSPSIMPAYKQTISHGGLLKDGVHAKLYLYEGNILRIDILKSKETPLNVD